MRKAKTTVATATQFVVISATDIAYRHGRSLNDTEQCARDALDHITGFPDLKAVSEQDIESFKNGYILSKKEIFKPVTYATINGHFVVASPEHISNDKVEKVTLTIDSCLAYTTHEMGKMEGGDKKNAIDKVRKEVQKYVSQRLIRLATEGKKQLNERLGIKTVRAPSVFETTLTKFFDEKIKSVKVRQNAGDETADPLKFRMAVEAFWKVYKA